MAIPNIDIGKVYDHQYDGAEVHYESFGRLADFFGRTTPAHHHDRFYQIHFLDAGVLQLQLDDQFYLARAPLVFFTPPAIPHAFSTEPVTEGHVLTIRQDIVRTLHQAVANEITSNVLNQPFCLEIANASATVQQGFRQINQYLQLLKQEFHQPAAGRNWALEHLTQLIVLLLFRIAPSDASNNARSGRGDRKLFQQFTLLVDQHYQAHWSLTRYANELCITEARLNEICRKVAHLSSKQLVFERLILEAKRQLLFAATPVAQVAYQLGFKDPAYFSRFFTRQVGMTPLQYRQISAEKLHQLSSQQSV